MSLCESSLGVAPPDWEAAEDYLPEIFCGEKLLREYPLAIDRTFSDDSLLSAATSPSLERIPITHIVTDLKLIRSVLPRSSCN